MPALDEHIQTLLGRPRPTAAFDLTVRLQDQTILVTGAGGSIGSALCRRLVAWRPARILAYDQSEYALYQVTQMLENCGVVVEPVLGDLSNVAILRRLLTVFDVSVVFHAAAYKHVPLVEQNPVAGLRNNVWSTQTLVAACVACQIRSVLVVSTDKAVNPTNVMGAAKRLAEYVTLQEPGYQVVRLGNVLGTTGSVLPRFYTQLTEGRPLTITHPEVSRYFMSVEEATELMLQAIALPQPILVLDMGEPVSIEALARRLAALMDVPDPEVVYIGLRPGEKLHEELTLGEGLEATAHPLIKSADETTPNRLVLKEWLRELDSLCRVGEVGAIRELLQEIVPGYHPSCGIVDVMWLQEYVMKAKAALDDCYREPKV